MRSLIALSLATAFMGLSLFGCSKQGDKSTPAAAGQTGEVDPHLNSQERMEERNNNSSIIYKSNRPTEWDGADKDEGRTPKEVEVLEEADKRRTDN